MAQHTQRRARTGEEAGVSLDPRDAIKVGLFGGGVCRATHECVNKYRYGDTGKTATVLLVSYTPVDDAGKETGEPYEEAYTVGNGYQASEDGHRLVPREGQTGLPDSCDAVLYYFNPLLELGAFDRLGPDITDIDGMILKVIRREKQFRAGLDEPVTAGKGGPKTKLVPIELIAGPNGARPGKASRRGATESRTSQKSVESNEWDADATEALREVLDRSGGLLKMSRLEDALRKVLKGNKDADAIIDRAVEDSFLELEDGWTYDEKKAVLELA